MTTDEKPQSWADWLLEPFASSISSPVTDSFSDSEESSYSQTTFASSYPDGTQAYGLGILTGQGGAGNFLPGGSSTDIELLQRPKRLGERRRAAAKLEQLDTAAAIMDPPQRISPMPYASIGRGGAGNMQLLSPRSTSGSSSRSPSYASSLVGTTGRGGSGNYTAAAEANARKQQQQELEDRAVAERKREEVAGHVDALLSPPPEAFVGGDLRRHSATLTRPAD